MAKGKNKEGLLYWIGGLSILVIVGLAVAPRLLSKKNHSGKHPSSAAGVHPAVIAAALKNKPGYDATIANSQYGNLNGYNFAGMALERPSNVLPLGFHLNNLQ